MGYQEIDLGNQPNDGQGDSGRAGGAKINSMFRELYEHTFINSAGVRVSRFVKDTANTDLTAYRADDKCERWADMDNKVRWVEGIVLDPTFVFPDDIDDGAKFMITNEKLKA
nr:hypothetical protein [Allomuricauda sp.]